MKKFLLCEMYPLRGYVLQFFIRTDSYSRERESHFRTVIALNNNVLIIIRYTRDGRSIICPFRLSHVQHVSYSRMRIRSRTFKK